jgi:BirA family biotin operon repressor/biotin-[acetyl-CoA-carboxylase] ligase
MIKWPNDVVVARSPLGTPRSASSDAATHAPFAKIAGILCEASAIGSTLGPVIVGIGVNVLQTMGDFPPHLRAHATSVLIETGAHLSRGDLATDLVARLRAIGDRLTDRLGDDEIDAFARHDALAGHRIAVDDRPAGVAAGIAPDGARLIDPPEGRRTGLTGTVRITLHDDHGRTANGQQA